MRLSRRPTGWLRLFCWLIGSLTAQHTLAQSATGELRGRVLDAATDKPLPFATVYLNNSTVGTTADEAGTFRLGKLPFGQLDLVASFVGYTPQRQTVGLTPSVAPTITFSLAPQPTELQTVTVKATRDRQWQRQVRQFEEDLFGNTAFGSECKLLNPQVLSFDDANGALTATATEPLQIENQALGYRLLYSLLSFKRAKEKVDYAGTLRFEPLTPTSNRQRDRWLRNRQLAYEGSLRHFLATLVSGTYEQAGFLAYQVNPQQLSRPARTGMVSQLNRRLLPLNLTSLLRPGSVPNERTVVATSPIELFYTKTDSKTSPYADAPYAFTEMVLPQGRMVITETGWVSQPQGLLLSGHLGQDRLGMQLPSDWLPGETGDAQTPTPVTSLRQPATARQDSLANRATAPAPPLVHLRPDQPFYFTGESVRVSAWLLDASTLAPWKQPAVLAIDLLDPSGRLVFHHWLTVAEGRTTDKWLISNELGTGLYRLRAYTTADVVAGRPAYERSVSIYNASASTRLATVLRADSVSVRAQPEGGQWVAGLPSRVGVQVADGRGRPLALSGQLIDAQGKAVAQWQTNAAGAGSVLFTPLPGQTYRAVVNTSRPTQPVALPAAVAQGVSLSLDATTDSTSAMLTLQASPTSASPTLVHVVVRSRGRVCQSFVVRVGSELAREPIRYATLPDGLASVALLSEAGQVVSERLFWVPIKNTLPSVRVQRQPQRESEQHQRLRLTVRPATATSMLALGDPRWPATYPDTLAPNLRTHALLTGWLRYPLPGANQYVPSRPDLASRRRLDEQLLTQQWRANAGATNPADLDSLVAMPMWRGRLLDDKGEPALASSLKLVSLTPGAYVNRPVLLDAKATFTLGNMPPRDSLGIWLTPQDERGRRVAGQVRWQEADTWFAFVPLGDSLLPVAKTQLAEAQHRVESDTTQRTGKTQQLETVVVKGSASEQEWLRERDRMTPYGRPDQVIRLTGNTPRVANLYELLNTVGVIGLQVQRGGSGYSVRFSGPNSIFAERNPLFLIDGVPIDDPTGSQLASFDPNDIERIDVLRYGSSAAMFGSRAATGVIAFITKRNRTNSNNTPDANRHLLLGATKPDQSWANDQLPQPTLYRPMVLTGADGTSSMRYLPAPGRPVRQLFVEGVSLQGGVPVVGSWPVDE